MSHILEHILEDMLPMLPILFLTYLLMEYLEHKSNEKFERFLLNARKLGPLIGSFLGIVPQCGFSVIASGLYMNKSITLGTLLAVFISTSDEAIPILISQPQQFSTLIGIIIVKIIVGIIVGYAVDMLIKEHKLKDNHPHHDIHEDCHEEEHNHGIVYLAFIHTIKIFIFIFIVNFILTIVIEYIGESTLSYLLAHGSFFQPILAAITGFIPNCGASVILSQLYLDQVLSFGALCAGLMTSAGLGLLVLLKLYDNKKDILRIVLILFVVSSLTGILLQLLTIV